MLPVIAIYTHLTAHDGASSKPADYAIPSSLPLQGTAFLVDEEVDYISCQSILNDMTL